WEPLPQAPILGSSSGNSTEKRDSELFSEAGSLQEKSLQDLSEEQAGDILNLVLVSSTEDPTEFISELERKIIPVGFGLSLGDLNKAFHIQNSTHNINTAETGIYYNTGSCQLFSVRLKKVQHQVIPGYIIFSKKIYYIQSLDNSRINFIIKTPNKYYNFINSLISNSLLAIKAAKNIYKLFTTSDKTKLKEYQDLVTRGGQYRIFFIISSI
ncbi:hypothetical protein BO71DRAFT_316062, partial [Aspergillus ellipticus CBS 707.79]